MNNKFKKGALALGTIATIAAPVAAVVSCGTTNSINWSDDDTYAGVKAKEFLNQIKHLGKTKQNAITVGREQMMELQYQSESIRSIMAQVEDFRYQNWQTEMENKKLAEDQTAAEKDKTDNPGAADDIVKGYETKIQSIKDSIKDNEDKIKKVGDFIAKINTAITGFDSAKEFLKENDAVTKFYKDDYNSSDYPEVYKPLSSIHDEKKAAVEDTYKNFYPEFNTKAEGDAEWPKELAANYGNAATFDQAVDYLVNQEISAKAFNSYKFEINKSFTVEKKLWAEHIDTKAWKFLIEDSTNEIAGSEHNPDLDADITAIGTTKAEIEANILKINKGEPIGTKDIKTSVLSSTEIFLGSTSPDHRMPKGAIAKLGHVVKYQHLLIKATQGKTPDEVWTIKGEDLQKLMEFDNYAVGTPAAPKIAQGIDLISEPKLFDDSDTDFTDFVLKAMSGNSAGTLKTQGSLGIKSEIEYLKEMVPGFSLGALSITEGTDTPIAPAAGNLDLATLATKLKDELIKQVEVTYPNFGTDAKAAKATDIDKLNTEIDAVIKTLGDDKVKQIFGSVFQDFFKDKTSLLYSFGIDKYVVISQFGIHIIKRTAYDATGIKGALKDDIKNMAKDSSLTSSTSISAELNTWYSDTRVMAALLDDADYKAELTKKLVTYNSDKTADVDKVEIDDITDVIKAVNVLNDKTSVDGAMGDKLENWLVSQVDAELRKLPTGKELSDIYGWAQTAQEGRK